MAAKFRFISDGERSCVELCGKSIGKGITGISFEHDAERDLIGVHLDIHLGSFEFMPDGEFDRFAAEVQGIPETKTRRLE